MSFAIINKITFLHFKKENILKTSKNIRNNKKASIIHNLRNKELDMKLRRKLKISMVANKMLKKIL